MQPTQVLKNLAAGALTIALSVFTMTAAGCRNDMNTSPLEGSLLSRQVSALAKGGPHPAQQINLVANSASYGPNRIDANLLNAWGIAMTPTGIIWIAANHASLSVIYDTDGNAKRPPVTIPTSGDTANGGAPTGVVFNPTADFAIPSTGGASRFIFAGEDGIISAWGSGNHAIIVSDRSSAEAVYKGLALANNGGQNFLFATNFKGGAVEVFDTHFQMVSNPGFQDPSIPAGFSPFGIQNVGGKLFVTYAKLKGPDNEDDQSGPGNGYIDIYSPNGTLLSRFASQGTLNSPWGIAKIPEGGFRGLKDAILVGNFGDGRINIFGSHGNFRGQLTDSARQPITIAGLWGLSFRPSQTGLGEDSDQPSGRLFFTAGPNDENDGVFGYLTNFKRAADLGDDDHDGENDGGGDGRGDGDGD
jgi:uncharacterized protein (TIGR03118 family)